MSTDDAGGDSVFDNIARKPQPQKPPSSLNKPLSIATTEGTYAYIRRLYVQKQPIFQSQFIVCVFVVFFVLLVCINVLFVYWFVLMFSLFVCSNVLFVC